MPITSPIVNLKSTIVNRIILLIEVGVFKQDAKVAEMLTLDVSILLIPIRGRCRGGGIQARNGAETPVAAEEVSILLIEVGVFKLITVM